MQTRIFTRICSILLAFALLCLFVHSPPVAAAETVAETTALSELDVQLAATEPDDFFTLAQIALFAYAESAAGQGALLSTEHMAWLDADESGDLDIQDASLLLTWYAVCAATGELPEDAQAFLARWGITSVPEATEVTQLETDAGISEITTTSVDTSSPPTDMTTTSNGCACCSGACCTCAVTTTETQTAVAATTTTVSSSAEADTTVTQATTTSKVETAITTTAMTTTTTTTATTTVTTTTTTTAATTATTTTAVTTTASGAWAQKSVYTGIDVSKWQGEIDWDAVAADGVEFAIIRAGYGSRISNEDPYFDQNVQAAKAAGIACGAYWYSYATTVEAARQEAEVFLQVIDGYQFEYPLVFDIEEDTQKALSNSEISAIITAFCEIVEDSDYYICVYSFASLLSSQVDDDVLEKYDIWVAHIDTDKPAYSKTSYGMWQYSWHGSVDGINGDVDLDYSYRCYPQIMINAHKNGF